MKKILKTLIASILCFCTIFAFTACGTPLSKTTNSEEGTISNGGISVYHDGWLYFINGTKTVNEANVKSNVVNGGIYRVKTDENGKILYNVTTDGDGNEIKTIQEIQPVINKIVGFKYGSIHIYGDFLYYATPSTGENKSGEMLTGKVEFRRYDLVNKKDQLIYVTKTSDEELTYDYVKQGDKLNLVVFEKNSATLTSLLIGDKITTVFVKNEVQSVLISEGTGNVVDGYIYYTLSYDKNSALKRGVRVYKILPDGQGEDLLCEGKSVSLLTVKAGRLVYSFESAIYSCTITNGNDSLVFGADDQVCTKNYENIIFVEDGENLSVLIYEDNNLRFISWDDETFMLIHEFEGDEEMNLVGVEGDWVIYTRADKLYKSRFKNVVNPEEKMPIQLSSTVISDADELLISEIVDGYLYAFSENTTTKATYLYRISLEKPEEVETAEFIGVTE